MLQQIISHTPLWVWALLAFLVYRGVIASSDREVALSKLFIVPIVMLALSIYGIAGSFGTNAAIAGIWLGAAILGGVLSWSLVKPFSLTPHPDRNRLFVRGSWTPLTIMMGIFLTKYSVGITLAMHPEIARSTEFVFGICALYGVFNGLLLGKLARTMAIYRSSVGAAPGVQLDGI